MKKIEDMSELELLELRMKESLEGRSKPKDGFLVTLWKRIVKRWIKEGLIVFLILISLVATGCEVLKPNSIGIGYGIPYYEDTPMWRGFNINARWDLK